MNLEYFKSKFDTLYKQNDTKREDIASKTGIDKNKITKLRKCKYPTQPTVDDLIAISDYYHVTVDELLRPQEESEQINDYEESFDSLGDIIEILFKIDHSIGIDFNTEINDNSLPLYILNPKIQDLIKEWTIIKGNLTSISDCGPELIKLWEQNKIDKYKEYTKKHLVNEFIAFTNSLLSSGQYVECSFNSNEIKLILNYANLPDISESKKQDILKAYKIYKDRYYIDVPFS